MEEGRDVAQVALKCLKLHTSVDPQHLSDLHLAAKPRNMDIKAENIQTTFIF